MKDINELQDLMCDMAYATCFHNNSVLSCNICNQTPVENAHVDVSDYKGFHVHSPEFLRLT